MLKCKVCGKYYSHLGSHIWHGHKMLAIDYKEKFGLDHKFSLTTPEIQEKKRIKALASPTFKENFKGSPKYYFKKGRTYKMGYVSAQAKRRQLENLVKINKGRRGQCPVCHIIFDSLPSHLYNKHKLLQVK
jgi:hypothetical protein